MSGCVDRKTLPFLLTFKKLCDYSCVDGIPRFQAQELCIMPTFPIYAFVMILTIILSNGNALCLLQGSN
jgi:hypothetical protein